MNTVMTATYFFNHAAPSVFAQLPEAKQGRIAFHITDEGVWVIDLAQKTVQGLALTDSIEVDLYIEMSSQNFIDFLQGTLPIQDAMEQRTLHLDGNMSLMVEMSKALRMLP